MKSSLLRQKVMSIHKGMIISMRDASEGLVVNLTIKNQIISG